MIVRAEAWPDCEEELARDLQDLAQDIEADEPGCLSYTVTRPIGSRTHFAVHARFSDWRAFKRHHLTEHMKRALPGLMAQLASAVTLEIFLEV